MSTEHSVQERRVHGLLWQIVLTDWGCDQAEANLAFASVCAQLETVSYADAVRMHAALVRCAEALILAEGETPDESIEYPVRALEIERAARRAALDGWPHQPRHSHMIHIGAIP